MVTIQAEKLARELVSVLERVSNEGETFVVERDGRRVATISPPRPTEAERAVNWAALEKLEWPDEDFGRDLEEIQRSQGPATLVEWPD